MSPVDDDSWLAHDNRLYVDDDSYRIINRDPPFDN